MFTSLRIRNFQVHKSLEIALDPRVTTIVGPSDVGKSAVLRALRWLCLNKPSGDAFLRHNASSVRVSVDVDGYTVTRRKGAKNTYQLDDQTFTAVGNTVPPPIAELLNVTEVNFQGQHEAAFWFSEPAGQISKKLNAIVNLGVIDQSLSHISSKLREAQTESRIVRERHKGARERKRALKWVPAAAKALARVERVADRWAQTGEELTVLEDLVRAGQKYRRAVRSVGKRARVGLDALSKLGDLATKAEQLDTWIENLEHLVHRIKEEERELWQRRREEKALEKELAKIPTCPTCGQIVGT